MSKKPSKFDPHAEREASRYVRPIPSREFILEHLKERDAPAQHTELLKELNLKDEDSCEALRRRLKAMVRDGQLERLKKGYYWFAGRRVLIEGRIVVDKGRIKKAWFIPDNGEERIALSAEDSQSVYSGNRVIVSVLDIKDETIREGKLVEITEQAQVIITGRFVSEKGFSHVISYSKEVVQNILIPNGEENTAQDGDIVVVELVKQPARWAEPLGRVLEVLGSEDTPGIEIQAMIRSHGLPEEFPKSVIKEAEKYSETVPAKAAQNRLDLRELPLVTIDGEDAKDFDDAVYCEAKSGGGFRLYVAIADVSHYVHPKTALDKEAENRGNSVYFPGQVVPMLPEVLSNGLCSLKPNVDRLCLVCIMTITPAGKISRYEFHEAIMRSHARLTYTKAMNLLSDQGASVVKKEYEFVLPVLKELSNLYQVLKQARRERGAIEFETTETKIIFGKNRKIKTIEPVFRNDAHRIIEECMLCANVACARFLKKHKLPGLYRNHEEPTEEKLMDLKVFLRELGLPMSGGAKPTPLDYAELLHSIQDRPDANIIQMVLLRSLCQAVYSKDNIGHFGLAYSMYAHFTSPIRRYPDLLVHRQIRSVLQGKWDDKSIKKSQEDAQQKELVKIAEHCSMTERRADDATRDVVRWLKCEYVGKHIGEEFDGIISGVIHFGFFVELKGLYIDGLVHVTSLKNDYYYFDQIHHRLMGERTGKQYRLGDQVRVQVSKVDVDDRKIDFELISGMEKNSSKKAHRSKKTTEPRKRKSKKRGK